MATEAAAEEKKTEELSLPASKKLKPMSSVLSPTVWDQVAALKASYSSAEPYPHAMIEHVFNKDFLLAFLEEVKQKSTVSFKESDLFKMYQSMDLANIKDCPENREKLPHVMQLRETLYSADWRHLIEDVIGLPNDTLSGTKVDCACNCHTTGCHLLCHDDVIGSRCVSYILYLTAEDWTEEEGGALELYPSLPSEKSQQHVPAALPSKKVMPLFNHIAFFQVQPGLSFHSVQEVFGDRPRLSLQGWYHYQEDSKQSAGDQQKATLDLLKERATAGEEDCVDTTHPFVPVEGMTNIDASKDQGNAKESDHVESLSISQEDQDYLKNYIDPTYFQPEALKEISQVFEEESSVQLQRFFVSKYHEALAKAIHNDDQSLGKDDAAGISSDWKLVGPPHKQRFLEYHGVADTNGEKDVGPTLAHLQTVLKSPAFCRWLKVVSSSLPVAQRGRIRRFRRGRDYTVAHHGLLLPEGSPAVLDATVCFVKDDEEPERKAEGATESGESPPSKEETATEDEEIGEEDMTWESGNVGGFEAYIAADDDEEGEGTEGAGPADEYNAEDDTELLSVSASHNTLSLVLRDTGTMRFVKYVGSRAPSSRWDIAMEYQLAPTDESADDTKSDT